MRYGLNWKFDATRSVITLKLPLVDELLIVEPFKYKLGFAICAEIIGNDVYVNTIDITGFHDATVVYSCVIAL